MRVHSSAWPLLLLMCGTTLAHAQDSIPTRPITSRAVATLNVPGYVDFLAADGGGVWVTNQGRVEQLRVMSAKPVASVTIPEPCGAMVAAFQSLWVASCAEKALYRIDLATRKVVAIVRTGLAEPNGELSLAAGAGSLWVLSDREGRLSRVNPATNKVIAQITVAPHSYAAVFDFGAVWITNTGPNENTGPGSVQRIDPKTNRVVATIPVGPVPRFLAAGEGGIWTLNQGDGTVSRIDPALNRHVVDIPVGVPGSGGDIAAGAGRVWVRATKILLSAIDPRSNRVVARYGPPSGSGAVRVAEGRVWVTAHDINQVWVLR